VSGGCLFSKGALAGGTVGLVLSFWLTLSSMQLNVRHPTLPPTSIDGCEGNNVSLAYNFSVPPWPQSSEGVWNNADDTATLTPAFFAGGLNMTDFRAPMFIKDTKPVNVILLR
jgi:hypothetical protein